MIHKSVDIECKNCGYTAPRTEFCVYSFNQKLGKFKQTWGCPECEENPLKKKHPKVYLVYTYDFISAIFIDEKQKAIDWAIQFCQDDSTDSVEVVSWSLAKQGKTKIVWDGDGVKCKYCNREVLDHEGNLCPHRPKTKRR